MRQGVAAAAALGGVLAVLSSCGGSERLPVYGRVPDFQLIAQNGQPFSRKLLDGSVWVADFFFTTCAGPCPRMTAQMHQVQKASEELPGVKLVSFTVDPARDTPPALAAYAAKFRADPQRWWFLTGSPETLNHLSWDVFHLGKIDAERNHSTRFILVDRQGRIRGYYLSSDEDFMANLLRDVRRLSRGQS